MRLNRRCTRALNRLPFQFFFGYIAACIFLQFHNNDGGRRFRLFRNYAESRSREGVNVG